jgi:hypothetical protein
MTDEELIAQSAVLTPVYIDGFGAFRKVNGVLRCVGWGIDVGAQLNLIVSLMGADQACGGIQRALRTEPVKSSIHIWKGAALAH